MDSVQVKPSFFTLDDYLKTLPDQKAPEGIQDAPLMGGEAAGDMSAFKITKVQRSCAANGDYSYSFLSQAALDGKLEGLPVNVQALLKDISVNAVSEDKAVLKLVKTKVGIACASIAMMLYWLQEDTEPETDILLNAFEAAQLIYREWPTVRRMYEESQLIKLRDECVRVFSEVVACRYAKLPGILRRNPDNKAFIQDMTFVFAADMYPANSVLDSKSTAALHVMVKSRIDAEISKEEYKEDPSLLHDHGITEEQYYSAERKRRMLKDFPVTPILK